MTDAGHVGVRAAVQGDSAQLLARRRRALSVLGLPEAADRRLVQRAFRRLASKLHPDRHPRASQAQLAVLMRDFAEVAAAYHELIA
jgi:DnaJ-class molecular chaperone